LYAQGELAGARKLEEQMLEALAPDMKAHGGGGEVGELSQVAALGDGENDVEMLKES
jgi:hydroxymethylpyrimidine pyrophosphatase-like HAD family hydrolase